MLNLLVIMNGAQERSTVRGGDYHLIRVLKSWPQDTRVSIILPKMILSSVKAIFSNIESVYFSSFNESEHKIRSYIRLYIPRIIRSLFYKSPADRPDVIIAASHLLCDIIPAIFLSLRFRCKLVVYVHVIVRWGNQQKENIKLISTLSERISLFLLRRANVIFVVNEDIKDLLLSTGFDSQKNLYH